MTRSLAMIAVLLNHFYLSVDSATYADIAASEFLRTTFAPVERRTTVRADRTYTGVYLYGTHTYFEFFDAGAQRDFPLHRTGLAFGVEQPGGVGEIRARVEKSALHPITRAYDGRQVPWFAMLDFEPATPEPVIDAWAMEYDARFLEGWHPALGDERGIERATVLRRYVRALKDVPREPLLRDVASLTIAASAPEIASVRDLATRLGYRASAHGDTTTLVGADATIRLVPESATTRGLTEAVLRVRDGAAVPNDSHFGARSVLHFRGDGTAVWTF